MDITEAVKKKLFEQGAALVGIGDMSSVKECCFPVGISVAVPVPVHMIRDLEEAPTKEYYELYHSLNNKLNEIVTAGEKFLIEKGYDAYAQTTDRVKVDAERVSKIPHKTVATRSGLGWIGKNCLLVTPEYGSAVRISSILTNAPLKCAEPYNESKCGNCTLCVRQCPAKALKGTLWKAGMKRKEIVDVEQCYRKQKEIMLKNTGIDADLCGKCFAVCLYTQKNLKQQYRNEEKNADQNRRI